MSESSSFNRQVLATSHLAILLNGYSIQSHINRNEDVNVSHSTKVTEEFDFLVLKE